MRLLPSLRQKKRYVVVEVLPEKPLSAAELKAGIEQALQSFWGQIGLARAGPLILSEKWHGQRGIIKVNHAYVDELKAALVLNKKIKNTSIILRSIATSGTLKTASSYLEKN